MYLRFEMVEGLRASSARPPGPCSLLGEGLAEKKQTDSDWDRRKRSKHLEGADIWELVETIIRSIRQSSTSSNSVLVRRKTCLELGDPKKKWHARFCRGRSPSRSPTPCRFKRSHLAIRVTQG